MDSTAQTPDDGHTFEISVAARGSYAVRGEPHVDCEHFGDPVTVQVRAWNLRDALLAAAATPLHAWAWPLTEMPDEGGRRCE
jgi:hypothetical protein